MRGRYSAHCNAASVGAPTPALHPHFYQLEPLCLHQDNRQITLLQFSAVLRDRNHAVLQGKAIVGSVPTASSGTMLPTNRSQQYIHCCCHYTSLDLTLWSGEFQSRNEQRKSFRLPPGDSNVSPTLPPGFYYILSQRSTILEPVAKQVLLL